MPRQLGWACQVIRGRDENTHRTHTSVKNTMRYRGNFTPRNEEHPWADYSDADTWGARGIFEKDYQENR